jgi:hypothetical protein
MNTKSITDIAEAVAYTRTDLIRAMLESRALNADTCSNYSVNVEKLVVYRSCSNTLIDAFVVNIRDAYRNGKIFFIRSMSDSMNSVAPFVAADLQRPSGPVTWSILHDNGRIGIEPGERPMIVIKDMLRDAAEEAEAINGMRKKPHLVIFAFDGSKRENGKTALDAFIKLTRTPARSLVNDAQIKEYLREEENVKYDELEEEDEKIKTQEAAEDHGRRR